MNTYTSINRNVPLIFAEENMNDSSVENKESLEQLKRRINELENELKKQKDAKDKDAKLLKFLRGDNFDFDFLH